MLPQGQSTKRNKMKKLLLVSSLVALSFGCASNKQQIIQHASGDGVYAKAAVPLGTWGSIGLSGFIGRFGETVAIQPTDTNKIYGVNLAIVGAGKGAQTINAASGTTTNGTAAITDGSWDAESLSTGSYGVSNSDSTNKIIDIQPK